MATPGISLRRFPYPYGAMLAICSDLDETVDWATYRAIAEFLNTTRETTIGRGVGLEVGNTLYFDMPPGCFSYWNAEPSEREQTRALIRSGHIDCFHSFGDDATDRAQVSRSLEDLAAHDCRMEVWIDHATAPTNFGHDIMRGHGDQTGHDAYHADLTIAHGVRFVWLGRVTSIVGQNARYRPFSVLRASAPISSTRTMLKDVAKQALSHKVGGKYRMHSRNRLTRSIELRSGHGVTEFMRCNPHPGGVSCGDTSRGVADVLDRKNLDALRRCRGSAIIYTHLGKQLEGTRLFTKATRDAFRLLANYARRGEIQVTTTRRLLGFDEAMCSAAVTASRGRIELELPSHCDPAGLTFYWDGDQPQVTINGDLRHDIVANPPDETGRRSVSVAWPPLSWPL